MSMLRIAINGFGRIGRTFLRSVLLHPSTAQKLSIVAINLGPSSPENLDLLFAYDSIMGTYPHSVSIQADELVIGKHRIKLLQEKDATQLPWKALGIDWVVDCSGHFTDGLKAVAHCTAGAGKVLISAPATNDDITIIPGVNNAAFQADKHRIVSLGSCTTNCFAPIVKIIHETFGISEGMMTTIHAYTNDQVLLDVEHKDPRRARAAALSMIPTKTGANKVITQIFPDLDGKIQAQAIRVPTPVVSCLNFTFKTNKTLSAQAINTALEKAAQSSLRGYLEYCDKPLVSIDFKGNPASAIVDSLLTTCTGSLGNVTAWYDNEFGYSSRLRDFLMMVADAC
jgi:glyceraldehyde 3-phosphate dehydrogenase